MGGDESGLTGITLRETLAGPAATILSYAGIRSGDLGDLRAGHVGASAALLGLIFVAVSINLEQLLRLPWAIGRAGDAMLLLLTVFIASAFVLVPEQADGALAVELIALGVAVMAPALVLSARRRPSVSADFRRPGAPHDRCLLRSNQVASTWDVADMEAFQAAQRSFPPDLAAAAERAGMIPPVVIYIKK